MCGFTGVNKNSIDFIDKSNKLMNYRGPDYAGSYTDQNISLGHVLLSLRGPVEDGIQPVQKEGSPWILLFNGQIYNTRNICKHNHINETSSDTVILYKLIQKYGWDFYEHIEGMYAIGLYNKNEREVRLYRDSAGQKPLYFYFKGNTFLFSSEVKVILAYAGIDKSADEESICVSLSIGYIPAPFTTWKYIQKVNVSECVIYNLQKNLLNKITLHKSFSDINYKETPKNFIKEVIEQHLQSNTEIKINLSGGLDSAVIYTIANELGYKPESFTTKYITDNQLLNKDAHLAKKLVKHYGGKHHEVNINQNDYLDNFINAYEIIEEPCYNQAAPSHLAMAKFQKINSQSKIVLCGDGGDEIFSGYSLYKKNKVYDRFDLPFIRNIFNLYRNRNSSIYFDNFNTFERWLRFKNFYASGYVFGSPDIKAYLKRYEDQFNQYVKMNKPSNSTKNHMLADRYFWLANENFNRIDKIFMSQTIEVRSPFSYEPLRNYCDSVIPLYDLQQTQSSKQFIRKLYKDTLPNYIINQHKIGWSYPISDWYNNKTKDLFLEIIGKVENNDKLINWPKLKKKIIYSEGYPGKWLYSFLSLAILSNKFSMEV